MKRHTQRSIILANVLSTHCHCRMEIEVLEKKYAVSFLCLSYLTLGLSHQPGDELLWICLGSGLSKNNLILIFTLINCRKMIDALLSFPWFSTSVSAFVWLGLSSHSAVISVFLSQNSVFPQSLAPLIVSF